MPESTTPFRAQIDLIVERLKHAFTGLYARVTVTDEESMCLMILSHGDRSMLIIGSPDTSGRVVFSGGLQEHGANLGAIRYPSPESNLTAIARAWFIDRTPALEMPRVAGTIPFPT